MRKILVSGAGGYVGNVLVRYLLERQYKVRAMDNFHKGQCDALLGLMSNNNFEFVRGDVTNPEDCERAADGCDGVVHLAAIVGFPACARQPSLAKAVNVDGTRNMLAASADKPFVFASTGSVYGKVEGICTEESPLNAQSLYGIVKKEAEELVVDRDKTVAFRFATGFGLSPCMRVNLLVNDFVYRAHTERALVLFQADFRRTFIHVYDMARTFHMGLLGVNDGHLKHKVYNAGANDLNWTKRELAEYVQKKTNCAIFYGDTGVDADQRDYEVSYDRWHNESFFPVYGMKDGIDELIKAAPLLQVRHQYE